MKGALHLPSLIQALYKIVAQPVLFSLDPEEAHEQAAGALRFLKNRKTLLSLIEGMLSVRDPRLAVTLGGRSAPNPIGLGAGFDKGGDLFPALAHFGFGFVETGTFTPKAQSGNNRPRLFRFKDKRALVNRMGFNNPGVEVLEERFKRWDHVIPIGVNIGKQKETLPEKAVEDYKEAFTAAYPFADYVTVNVSSPNTPNLRDLQAVESLEAIVRALDEINQRLSREKGKDPVQIFIKVAPDLAEESLHDITRMAIAKGVGLIATNTTIDHSALNGAQDQAGGLSGAPLKRKANTVLKGIYAQTKGAIPLIGVGGIETADDVYEKIKLGANAVQIYTGWIYHGPDLLPRLNKGLLTRLERDGFKSVEEAVGAGA